MDGDKIKNHDKMEETYREGGLNFFAHKRLNSISVYILNYLGFLIGFIVFNTLGFVLARKILKLYGI